MIALKKYFCIGPVVCYLNERFCTPKTLKIKKNVYPSSGSVAKMLQSEAWPKSAYIFLMLAISLEVMWTLCMRNPIQNELWLLPAYSLYGAAFSLFPFVLLETFPCRSRTVHLERHGHRLRVRAVHFFCLGTRSTG